MVNNKDAFFANISINKTSPPLFLKPSLLLLIPALLLLSLLAVSSLLSRYWVDSSWRGRKR